ALDARHRRDRRPEPAAHRHPRVATRRTPGGGRGLAVPEPAAMRRAPGFTLLEVMASLAIFGLIAAAGVAVMAYAADSQDVLRERMDRLGDLQRARALLHADLSQAAVRLVRRADGSAGRHAFIGGRPGEAGPLFAFVRRGHENPDGAARASLEYVEYRIADGRLERGARTSPDGSMAATARVVLEGI